MGLLTASTLTAQTHPAAWQFFQKGNYQSYIPAANVEEVKFTDTNYDTYVYAERSVNEQGQWVMKLSGYGHIGVATTRIGVVPAAWPDSLMEKYYQDGTIANLHEAKPDTSTVYNRAEFVVDEGSWRPIIFGFDAAGQLRSHYLGAAVTFDSKFVGELNQNLIRPADSDQYQHYDFGYASLMHIRDVMGEDMTVVNAYGAYWGYDWFSDWERNTYLGPLYYRTSVVWRTLAQGIQEATRLINTMTLRSKVTDVSAPLATAYAQRALLRLDAARMYEFLPNDGVSSVNQAGNDVLGLTYTTATDLYDSTAVRCNRQTMVDCIVNDLNEAEALLEQTTTDDKLLASKAVVSGLKARLYMWTENYALALRYATRAIEQSGATPLTREQWLSTTQGFNDRRMPAWMWAFHFTPDCRAVESGIVNWTSWMSPEYTKGYAATPTTACIGKSIYDRIADTDFRKLSFKAPAGSALSEQVPTLGSLDECYTYTSVKFRPGQGITDQPEVSCAVDVPLMRVEEMYFIQMEAEAQQGNLVEGSTQLNKFMKQYRNDQYAFIGSSKEELVEEIFLQKRIELWGEGLNYFDYKRLNHPVTRSYEGTNFPSDFRFNTTTRPAWMNFVFVTNAFSGAVENWNNPDPSNCYETAN